MIATAALRSRVWIPLLVGAALALAAAAPCGAQSKTVVLLLDVSDSTPAARADYQRYAHIVFDHLKGGDTLLLGAFGRQPGAAPLVAHPRRLPACNPLTENCRAVERRARAELLAAADETAALLRRVDDETALLDTLALVPRLFANHPADRKVLVLLSDMREYTRGGQNFEGKAGREVGGQAERLIAALRAQGRMPDLAGVQVYVAAARDTDATRLRAVQAFWTQYFNAAGAALRPEHYGADLQGFAAECPRGENCVPYFAAGRHRAR